MLFNAECYKKIPLICWFDQFVDSGAEFCQIFCWFFGKFNISKRHSEINWPLDWWISGHFDKLARLYLFISFHLFWFWILVTISSQTLPRPEPSRHSEDLPTYCLSLAVVRLEPMTLPHFPLFIFNFIEVKKWTKFW